MTRLSMQICLLTCMWYLALSGEYGGENQTEWSSRDSHWVKVASTKVEETGDALYPSKLIDNVIDTGYEWGPGDKHWKSVNSIDTNSSVETYFNYSGVTSSSVDIPHNSSRKANKIVNANNREWIEWTPERSSYSNSSIEKNNDALDVSDISNSSSVTNDQGKIEIENQQWVSTNPPNKTNSSAKLNSSIFNVSSITNTSVIVDATQTLSNYTGSKSDPNAIKGNRPNSSIESNSITFNSSYITNSSLRVIIDQAEDDKIDANAGNGKNKTNNEDPEEKVISIDDNELKNNINETKARKTRKHKKKSHNINGNAVVDVKMLSPDLEEEIPVLVKVDTSQTGSCLIVVPAATKAHLQSGELDVNVTIPTFISTTLPMTTNTFGVHMSHQREESDSGWAIVAVKLKTDKLGTPIFSRQVPDYDIHRLYSYKDKPGYDEPYITAVFGAQYAPYEFIVGDGDLYGGYTNGPLDPGQFYALFVAAVLTTQTGKSMYAVTGWVEDAHSRGIPAYFKTLPKHRILFPLGILLFIVVVFGIIIVGSYFKRARINKNKNHKKGRIKTSSTKYRFSNLDRKGKQKLSKKHRIKNKLRLVEDAEDYNKLLGSQKINQTKRISQPSRTSDGSVLPSTLPRFTDDAQSMPAYPGNHLIRHFKDSDELEETVFSMHPEDHSDHVEGTGHSWDDSHDIGSTADFSPRSLPNGNTG